MAEGQPTVADVTELAEALHRVLMALNLRAHRRDRSRLAIGDLTVAQLSILLTLRDQGPIRTSKLSVVERVGAPAITRGDPSAGNAGAGEAVARHSRFAVGIRRAHAQGPRRTA